LLHKPRVPGSELQAFLLIAGVFLVHFLTPQANVKEAEQRLADQIMHFEQEHTLSLLIILGDCNRTKLSHELPKY